jgi:hypothetical protein
MSVTTIDDNLVPGLFTDRSGSVATGGTSQIMMAASNRRRLTIENPYSATTQGISAAENLFIRFGAPAKSSEGNCIELLPGGSYDSDSGPCTRDVVYVVAATSGHQFYAAEMF